MGGVNFLDSLISKYSYCMRSKRWYVYLFWHTIATRLIQGWLLYRKHCTACGMSKKQIFSHRRFQAIVASSLIMKNVLVRQRGRRSEENVKVYSLRPLRPIQPNDVCHDCVGHLPNKLLKRGHCSFCKTEYTDTACEKLCFNEKRNCYRDYHRPNF